MAFQIEENKLSSEAKKALMNSKSKSQFVRDAIEFYVKNRGSNSPEGSEVINEIREIKELLLNLSQGCSLTSVYAEAAITKEVDKPAAADTKTSKTSEPEIIVLEQSAERELVNTPSMDDEQRKAIEKLLDDSLDNF